jgi:hypothetical protein
MDLLKMGAVADPHAPLLSADWLRKAALLR